MEFIYHFFDKLIADLKNLFYIVALFLFQYFLAWLFFIPFSILFFISPEEWGQNESLVVAHELGTLFMITGSVAIVSKIVREMELRDFGLERNFQALKDFFAGLTITLIVLGMGFLFLLVIGMVNITGFAWSHMPISSLLLYLLVTFIIFFLVGWNEELLSRGFHLQIIESKFGKFIAVLVSSVMFSYMHRFNKGIDLSSHVLIFFAGSMLAYAYLKTRSLWLPIGLHAGWDFFVVVGFYGVPLNDIKIFNLIDISISRGPFSGPFLYVIQYIELALIVYLVNWYSRQARNTI